MHPFVTKPRLIVALVFVGSILHATPGTAQSSPSPEASIATSPGATATNLAGDEAVDQELAAACESHGAQPERCYLEGEARVSLRGAVRRSAAVPLEWGVGATSDVVPSISLRYEVPGAVSLVIDLPGVPGTSRTPKDGDSAGPGEAQLWWSFHDGPDSGTHQAGYGHACVVDYVADAEGRLAGSIRCPDERLGRQQRYRVAVEFEATPVVRRPLPTPMPTPSPPPPSVADDPCALVDDALVARAVGARRDALLLLDAGQGRCVGLVDDMEAVFLSVRDGATALELGATDGYRGATCTPLPSPALGATSTAASCEWPDGRTVVAGNVLEGSLSLVASLSSDAPDTVDLASGVEAVLAAALARLP